MNLETNEEERYWDKLLHKDYENWILYSDAWLQYFKNITHDYIYEEIKFFNYENKGFILLVKQQNKDKRYHKDYEYELFFGYVHSKYRGKKIMRKLIDLVKQDYSKISLVSCDERSDKVWEKLGFKFYTKERDNGKWNYMIL